MIIVETIHKTKHKVQITLVNESDFKAITKKRYFFDWKLETKFELYKLSIVGENDILGLISFENIPDELRFHIRLLTVSKENVGEIKMYENIASNLITFVSKLAVKEYAEFACVSLKPKGSIAQHYINKYGMQITGATLSVEILEIMNLINKYDDE